MNPRIAYNKRFDILIRAIAFTLTITFLSQGIAWSYPDLSTLNHRASLAQKTLPTTEDKIVSFERVALTDINVFIFAPKRSIYTLASIKQNLWPHILSFAKAHGFAEGQMPKISDNDYISDGFMTMTFASGYEVLFYDPNIFKEDERKKHNLARRNTLNLPRINNYLSVQYSAPATGYRDLAGDGAEIDEPIRQFEEKAFAALKEDERTLNDLNREAQSLYDMEIFPAFSGDVDSLFESDTRSLQTGVEELRVARHAQERVHEILEGLPPLLRRDIAFIVYEICCNVQKPDKGDGGIVTLRKIYDGDKLVGIEVVALDKGSGISDIERAVNEPSGNGRGFRTIIDSIFAKEGEIVFESNDGDKGRTFVFNKDGRKFIEKASRSLKKGTRARLTLMKEPDDNWESPPLLRGWRDLTRLNKRGEGMRLADLGSLYSQDQIDRVFNSVLTAQVINKYHLTVHSTLGEIFRNEDITSDIKKDLHDILIDEYIERFYGIAINPETGEHVRRWHTFGEETYMTTMGEVHPEEYEIHLIERFFTEILGFPEFSNTMKGLIKKKRLNVLHVEDDGSIFDAHASPEFGINVCSSCPEDLIGPAIVHELMAYRGFTDDIFNEYVAEIYRVCRNIWDGSPKTRIKGINSIDRIKGRIKKSFGQQAMEASAELREDEVFDILDLGMPEKAGVKIVKIEPFNNMEELKSLNELIKPLRDAYKGQEQASRASRALLEISNRDDLVRLQREKISEWIPRLVATCAFGGPTMQWEAEQYLIKIIDGCVAIPLDDIFFQFQVQDIDILGHRLPGENETLGNLESALKRAYLDEWSSPGKAEALCRQMTGARIEDEPLRMERMIKEVAALSRRGRYFDSLDKSKFPDAPTLAGLVYRKAWLLFQEYMRRQARTRRDLIRNTGFVLNRYDYDKKEIEKEIRAMLITISDNIERFSGPPFGITIYRFTQKYIDFCRATEQYYALDGESRKLMDSDTPDMARIGELVREKADVARDRDSLEKDFVQELLKISAYNRDFAKLAGGSAEDEDTEQAGKAMNIMNLKGLPNQTLPTLDELDIKIKDRIITLPSGTLEGMAFLVENIKPDEPSERAGDIRMNIETIFREGRHGLKSLKDVFYYLIRLADKDPEFRELLLAALRSPPNTKYPIVFAVSKNLPVDSARYFHPKTKSAIIVFNDKFFDLVRQFKDESLIKDAACHVVGERLLHELRHKNMISHTHASEVNEEVRVIKNNDMQFWRITENIGMLDRIDELRKVPGVKEAMHHSGDYFKEIRGFANRAYQDGIDDEIREFVEKYIIGPQPGRGFNLRTSCNLKEVEKNAEAIAQPLRNALMALAANAPRLEGVAEEKREERVLLLDMPEGQTGKIKGLVEEHIIKPLTTIDQYGDETLRANIRNLSIYGRDKIGVVRGRINSGALKSENVIVVTSESGYRSDFEHSIEFARSFITAMSDIAEEDVYYPYLEAAFFAIMRALGTSERDLIRIYEQIPNIEPRDEEALKKMCFDETGRPKNYVILKLLPKPVKFNTEDLERTYERIEEFLRKA